MHGLEMLSFTRDPAIVNGIFLTPKSDTMWRVIIDAQPLNERCIDPPHTELPSPAALASLVSTDPFYIAKLDLDNYYHRLLLPESYRKYFALPPVRLRDIGITVAGFDPDELVYPCCTTMAMGWTHAVYLAQEGHRYLLIRDAGLTPDDFISDAPVIHITNKPCVGQYIDDVFLFCTDKGGTEQLMDRLIRAYPGVGLVVKQSKLVRACRRTEVLGLEVDGFRGTVALAPAKIVKLQSAVASLLQRGRCSGEHLSSLLGNLTWAALVRRPCLSVFQTVYRFVQVAGARVCPLWRSVRNELEAVYGLLPLMFARVGSPCFQEVVATDACTTGGAVVTTRVSPTFCLSAAAVSSRKGEYVRPDSYDAVTGDMVAPTPAAPTPQPAQSTPSPQGSSPPLTPPSSLSSSASPSVSISLPMGNQAQTTSTVAASFLSSPPPRPPLEPALRTASWSNIIQTRWRYQHHINILEGNALLLAFRWLASRPAAIGTRVLFLLDSRVLVGAAAKGRSSSGPLLHVCRRIAAHVLALGLHPYYRWISTHDNPADEPSRR
jgi:hypothetical protein